MARAEKRKSRKNPIKTVYVKKVLVKDATLNVSFIGGQNELIRLPLPDLVLREIGKPSRGVTFPQASAVIFEKNVRRHSQGRHEIGDAPAS